MRREQRETTGYKSAAALIRIFYQQPEKETSKAEGIPCIYMYKIAHHCREAQHVAPGGADGP